MFLDDGACRFVFEGRECGGHIGPRTSFALWDGMVDVLLEHLAKSKAPADSFHILFAGGVHDGLSAAMVSALAAPLAEKGVRLGVLIGTAYLFTEEAVRCGAIQPGFQKAAVACDRTTTLESGPGHATRCIPSPFADAFFEEKRKLIQQDLPAEELRNRLEMLNIGRLRIASKGVDRNPLLNQQPDAPKLVPVGDAEQWERGMYMIGQVAALRDRTCTLAELHEDVANGSARILADSAPAATPGEAAPPRAAVAIVGIGTILPGAQDASTFWSNILNKVDAITEVPPHRWDWRQYYDPDRTARDKVYSRWGGFLDDVPFDPVAFGMPPSTVPSIEPFQLLALAVVRAALEDAGYADRSMPRDRTSVILGAGGGGADLTAGYMVRSSLPNLFGFEDAEALADGLGKALPEWTEDSFAGLLMNVAAGRVANRFDFGGVNYTVDAACASSLAAVYLAVRDLEARTSDVVVVGGVDAIQNPFSFLCFSKTQALSPTGRCRPFDTQADGIAISEGFAALVMKRLEDAERDGDRIYAVIRGVGGSSDGRDRSLTAPRPEGQIRALRRAYAQARFTPSDVGLIEAHGTGTVAGDKAEVQALTTFFGEDAPPPGSCAIGSVKSMIGHTKATAGVAGLAKVALALHHRVLPPTLGITRPVLVDGFPDSPLYVNTEARPWVQAEGKPRRAGVSAFGFGGTNFHVALEEYQGAYLGQAAAALDPWPAEVFVWRGADAPAIAASASAVLDAIRRGARPKAADLAYSLALQAEAAPADARTLAVVASTIDDLAETLARAIVDLRSSPARLHGPNGVHFAADPLAGAGAVAFLFPGQGSQYVDMFRDLAVALPAFRADLDRADAVLADRLARPLSRTLYPPPAFDAEEQARQKAALTETPLAQSALGAVELALLHRLRDLGIEPGLTAGHSYGEFVALAAAGSIDEADLLRVSEARGRFIVEEADGESGTMLAVEADAATLGPILQGLDITVANLNAPKQTVLSGSREAIEGAAALCASHRLNSRPIPVACGFHSPFVAPAQRRLAEALRSLTVRPPRVPVFSNTTAAPYADDPAEIVTQLSEHLTKPVEFVRQVGAMHEAGARVFVEVGPRRVLSGLVGQILGDRPHVAIPLDGFGRPGLEPWLNGLASLGAEGVAVRWSRLFAGRSVRRLDLSKLDRETGRPTYSPTTWLLNGGKARPACRPAEPPKIVHVRVVEDAPLAATEGVLSAPDAVGDGGRIPPPPRTGSPARTSAPDRFRELLQTEDEETQTVTPLTIPAPADARRLVPTHAPPPLPGPSPTLPADVIRQFQHVMQQFLQTQQSVMHDLIAAYRGSGSPAALPSAAYVNGDSSYLAAGPMPEPFGYEVQPAADWREPHPEIAPNGNGAYTVPHFEPAPPPVVAAPEPTPAPAPVSVLAPPAPPTPAPADAARPTRDQLTERLLEIVVDRTGYPTELLALDADLEADLGIDSIKRVEIAGTIVRSLRWPPDSPPDLERLTGARSLRQVVDQLDAMLGQVAPVANGEDRGHPFDRGRGEPSIGRFHVEPTFAPPISRTAALAPGGLIVVVDDGTPLGEAVAAALIGRGHPVARVAPGALSRPEGVSQAVASLAGRPVAGLVHLAPLRPGAEECGLEPDAWMERLATDLHGLFLLSQALADDLERSAENGGAVVLGATALGGSFATDGLGPPVFAGQGAVAGFLKTLAQEWPSVRVKAVDLDPDSHASHAEHLLAELFADDGLVEVGYRDGQRTMLRLVAIPAAADEPRSLEPGAVVLITGGARGITAEVAVALAEAYRPTLVLVGRTPAPEGPEPSETADLVEPVALRRALLEGLKAEGQTPTPARVEGRYRRLLGEREVRRNLQRLRQAGARVEYVAADVADVEALGSVVAQVVATHGRIDAVIHGAGVIEDKLVRGKSPESFDRVVRTKVLGALALARSVPPEPLRFFGLFSSVSGRFGNRGQGDYAAANEVLNKLAQQLDAAWPGRVVAINWGPWLTAGMVSPEVQRQFAERGVALIPVEEGCRRLLDELRLGRKGEAEVVIGGAKSLAASPAPEPARDTPPAAPAWPLVATSSEFARSSDGVSMVRTLDPARDRYLNDHRIDGRPVLPFVVAMEMMAEAAAAGWPELEVSGLDSIRLLKGVTLTDGPTDLLVTLRPSAASNAARGRSREIALDALIASTDTPARPHYKATVLLRRPGEPAPAPKGAAPLAVAGSLPMGLDEAYREWLFHGPIFKGIAVVDSIGPEGARARLRTSTPADCLADRPAGTWLLDPVMLDSALQIQVLWGRLHWDMTLLPNVFASYRIYGPRPADAAARGVRHEMRTRPGNVPPACVADHDFFDHEGHLFASLHGVEGTASRALNRIAQGQRG
jgi:acyl transferase domain-containing protein/NAD(P)-dependent dehydrogenase (short-subunit alcohol dehydrogenase family)